MQDVGMPADYVNKLARMFQDVKVSEDLNQHFKDVHRNKGSLAGMLCLLLLLLFTFCFQKLIFEWCC